MKKRVDSFINSFLHVDTGGSKRLKILNRILDVDKVI